MNQDEKIELSPFYHDLRNEIVEPKNVIVESKYFWDKWKPRLGPTLTVIIMELRRRCYYNPETGERRNYCWPSLKFLAEACGIGEKTIERELDRPEAKFFVRIEARGKRNGGKGGRTSNKYYVAMDDPLLPEDKEKLEKIITTPPDLNRQIVDQPTTYSSNCRLTPDLNRQIVDQPQSEQSPSGLADIPSQKGMEDVPSTHEEVHEGPEEAQKTTTLPPQISNQSTEKEKILLEYAKDTLPNYTNQYQITPTTLRAIEESYPDVNIKFLIAEMAAHYLAQSPTNVYNWNKLLPKWVKNEIRWEKTKGGNGENNQDISKKRQELYEPETDATLQRLLVEQAKLRQSLQV